MNTALLAQLPVAPVADPPIWRPVLRLAWPVMCQSVLIATVTLVDRYLAAGAGDDATPSAAQTTATNLVWLLLTYAMLVTTGSSTLVAYLIGAGERRTASAAMHQSLLLALVLGLIGTAVGLLGTPALVRLIQPDPDAQALAAAYLRPLLWLLAPNMLCLAGIACLAGAGDTHTGLFVLGGVAVINMPLAMLFSRYLGFTGISLGTAVSQALGGGAVLAVLWRGRAGLRLEPALFRPRPDLLRRLLRVSVPASLDGLSMQVGYLWFVGIVSGLGTVAAAAHGHAVAWEGLAYMLGVAFSTSAVTVVGQYKGAGRPDLAARGGWAAFALGASVMSAVGAVFFTLATPMLRLFASGEGQQPVVEMGVPVLRLVAFGMPALASCMILAAALRGAGDTRVPVLFTWAGFFLVRIPLAYLLTRPGWGLGLLGAWLGMFADMHVRGLFVLWRFASGRWKRVKV